MIDVQERDVRSSPNALIYCWDPQDLPDQVVIDRRYEVVRLAGRKRDWRIETAFFPHKELVASHTRIRRGTPGHDGGPGRGGARGHDRDCVRNRIAVLVEICAGCLPEQ